MKLKKYLNSRILMIYHFAFIWLPFLIAFVRETERAINNVDFINQAKIEYGYWKKSLLKCSKY